MTAVARRGCGSTGTEFFGKSVAAWASQMMVSVLLAGDFDETREEFQALAHFPAIDGRTGDTLVVSNHPTQLMGLAIGPKKFANLPDIIALPTGGTAMHFTAAVYGKTNYIVEFC